jgi:tripartite-type tricarboxylate transporter receptor subunit TctC
MQISRRLFLCLGAGVVALPAFTQLANAQAYPSRPITMVVPFAPGGAFDVLGRIFAPVLSDHLGRQVIVENVGGAGGMTGVSRVARSPADGCQFVLGDASTFAINQTFYKKPLYNAATDFEPVTLIAEVPQVLVARKDLPLRNLREFIAYTRTNQAKMQFGSAGPGTGGHLTCTLLNTAIDVNVTHVPYRGAAPALQDLVGGQIDYVCTPAPTAISQIEGRVLNAVAILTKYRSPSLPALASAHEQGLPDFEASNWGAFFFPKGTPANIVQRLHDATVAASNSPAVRERLKEVGADPIASERRSPDLLAKFVLSEIQKWAGPIKASGVSAD